MRRIERAAEAIRAAENAVASLVSEAGQEREWDEASTFIEIGRRLRNLVDELSAARKESPQSFTADMPSPAVALNVKSPPAPKSHKKAVYPQFFKEGEMLVKVAWSKSQRSEYEHKSPRRVLILLVDSLLKVGSKGKRLTMDKVLPLHDTENAGAEMPDYQGYVCLAWLRHEGLIQQHGRSGYSIPKPGGLAKSTVDCWERLKSR